MTDRERSHVLPPERNEELFRTRIVQNHLAHVPPSSEPTLYIVGGQPGAGKSTVIRQVRSRMDEPAVRLDADDFRPYHDEYTDLMAEDDQAMGDRTHPDARIWFDKACEYARDHDQNVLMERTMGDPAGFERRVAEFREAGYRVEVDMVAAPEAQSRLGIIARYETDRRDNDHGRWVPRDVHDDRYDGILDTAEAIDEKKLADRVTVSARDGRTLYENHLDQDGEWAHETSARAAMVAERERPWTVEESKNFTDTCARIEAETGDKWSAELDEIRELARPLQPGDERDPAAVGRAGSAAPDEEPAPAETSFDDHERRQIADMVDAQRDASQPPRPDDELEPASTQQQEQLSFSDESVEWADWDAGS